MISEPRVGERAEQHYVGIRTQVPHTRFPEIIPQYHSELFAWLGAQGVAPAGAPFMRYYVIDMAGNMDVELGVPVADAMPGEGRIAPGTIPAGRYASLVYTGLNGMPGNAALIGWAENNNIQWDRWDDPNGDAFRARVEYYLTEPAEEPDQDNWETEVAIKLADR
jgi:effector-binding domain-containing protein